MSDQEQQSDEQTPAQEESLADTEPAIHEEGKSLNDPSKDLGEKLVEIFEKRESND
jgi:hypothetical protein